jgi:hypothetical protein
VGHEIAESESWLNMAIFVPKSTKISLFFFSCTEMQSVGISPSMALVHLLVHARWWGHLVRLDWDVAKGEGNIFIFSQ